jgi:hypothetical protein
MKWFVLLFLFSCSMGTIKEGGERTYTYDLLSEYDREELVRLSSELVVTSRREPRFGKLEKLFAKTQAPLKRVGILTFESVIQPTRDGLAGKNLVYLSESGKECSASRP